MKNFSIIIATIFILPNSFASSFLGKMGPFSDREYSEHSLKMSKYNQKWSRLLLVAKANGKYSIPRYNYREVSIEYVSGESQNIIATDQMHSIKKLPIKLNAGDCVKSISVDAINTGINPGRTNSIVLEVWAER